MISLVKDFGFEEGSAGAEVEVGDTKGVSNVSPMAASICEQVERGTACQLPCRRNEHGGRRAHRIEPQAVNRFRVFAAWQLYGPFATL